MSDKQGLTPKQERFVEEYLVDLNATQAALRAGYSEKTAYSIGQEILKKPEIQQAIQAQKCKRSQRVRVTQDEIIRDLLAIKERCMQATPVVTARGEQVYDENGDAVWAFDAKNAIKALELLGKHLVMFTDKIQADTTGAISIQWQTE